MLAKGFTIVFTHNTGGSELTDTTTIPGQQAGDVVVVQDIPGHRYGHMAMFNGTQWVSDFRQPIVTYPSRQLNKPTMALIVKRNSLTKIAPTIESNANQISFNIMSVNYKSPICNSQEGHHVYSKRANSKEHLYLPLGYEVQPNFPEEDYY